MEWNYPDIAMSVFSLIAKNNGFFKSAKQRDFLQKQISAIYVHDDSSLTEKHFNIKLQSGQKMWMCEGDVRWAEYGRKSFRRVAYALVFDQYGFVSKNKIHFNYSSDGGSSEPNPQKTELNIWVRDTSVDLPVFVENFIVQSPSEHVGAIGEWLETVVTVKSIRAVGQGYYGTTYQTKMVDDDGNIIIYWGVMKDSSVVDGEFKIKLRAKVKEHSEYKGLNQTIVGYAKIKEVIE